LINDQPAALVRTLEDLAVTNGLAAPLFLAETVQAVHRFFHQHDECGGIRLAFIQYLDKLVSDRMPKIDGSTPIEAAHYARDFRDEIFAFLAEYNPASETGL
jgi:hypothetical protein